MAQESKKRSTSGRCASLKTSSRLHEEQKAGGRPTPEPGDPSRGEHVSQCIIKL